jgi:aspartate aminotransferase-like enzyme
MVPPGLTMLSVSPAAWERSKTAKAPRFYMDWAKEKKNQLEGATFTTPSLSIMFGLREGLKMLKEEGLPNVFRRHRRIAAAFRAALKALDIKLLAAPDYASPTVTAAYLPEKLQGDGGRAFFKLLRERYNLVIAGGQAQLHGKIFRIGHLGAVYDDDVIATITALEAGLKDLGLGPAAGKTGASALEIAKRALASAEPALIS